MSHAILALEDGAVFEGRAFGAKAEIGGEVVFNTSMFGYQEILTDPSYEGQIVTMSAAEIGNVGTNEDDDESGRPHASGFVVRRATVRPSSWRSREPLGDYLARYGIPGIEEIDTRKLVRHLRTHGAKRGVLSTQGGSPAALVERARAVPSMEGLDLATALSTKEPYTWDRGTKRVLGEPDSKAPPLGFHVVACDYGLKRAMLELIVDAGARVTVVPASFSAGDILALKPNGVFLTNGPGDPAAVVGADRVVSALLGKVPIFGICLGHQILARALGGSTYKMKFGHRGANQPVKDQSNGRVEITTQNHGFAVDAASVKGKAIVSHVNLNDGTVEGLSIPDARAFSVQHHPEASPGPHDARALFGRFAHMMAG